MSQLRVFDDLAEVQEGLPEVQVFRGLLESDLGDVMVGMSDREAGRIERDIENLQHRARNDRTILLGLTEEMEELRLAVSAMRVRIYTTVSVAAFFVSATLWVLEFLTSSS